MPQTKFDPAHGWIRGDQLAAISRQHLEASEVDPFLAFLFGDIAERPGRLTLREAARVVRYLRLLALFGVPNEVGNGGQDEIAKYLVSQSDEERRSRLIAEKAAEIIWGAVWNFGSIAQSGKAGALQFLRTHSKAYLSIYGEPVLKFVEDFALPPGMEDSFRPPNLHSRSMSVQGVGNPYLQNDLSERIYAAHHALSRENVEKSRARIAAALEVANVAPNRRKDPNVEWGDEDVNSRIKQYDTKLRKKLREGLEPRGEMTTQRFDGLLQNSREQLADKWISSWRWKLFVEEKNKRRAQEGL